MQTNEQKPLETAETEDHIDDLADRADEEGEDDEALRDEFQRKSREAAKGTPTRKHRLPESRRQP